MTQQTNNIVNSKLSLLKDIDRLCKINCTVLLHTEVVKLHVKGIVSRDWGGLQISLLDRLEVFNISATHFFKFRCRFHTVFLKMAA